MVMQMYTKPRRIIMDRHILVELDGDYTDYELKHLLRKAYENHKAPHEYDDIKKYIRDIIIGEHNSLYIQKDGQPNAMASATTLLSSYMNSISNITTDYVELNASSYQCGYSYYFQSSCGTISTTATYIPTTASYSNGKAIPWILYYTTAAFSSSPTNTYGVGPFNNVCIYGATSYAPYVSSTNPLTLTTYYQWTTSPSFAYSYSYVYFMLTFGQSTSTSKIYYGVPLFYTTGSFSFNPSTQYIGEWQFTYS